MRLHLRSSPGYTRARSTAHATFQIPVTRVIVRPGFFVDIHGSAMQTNIMLGKPVFIQAMLGVALLGAQQPVTPSRPGPPAPSSSDKKLTADAQKLTAKILSSYYHPDKLTGLECDVTPDWTGFFKSTRTTMSQNRMKSIQALKIHVRAVRDHVPELAFHWTQGKFAGSDQVEQLLKQSIGRFYQVYWSMFASPALKYAAVISKIEPQPDGTTKVFESDPNAYVVMTVDKHDAPIHYTMQSPSANGVVDAHYTPSPHPSAGDRRRISEVDVTEQSGASTMKVEVSMDYQPLGAFFVPGHVSLSQVGAYTMPMDFSACRIAKAGVSLP